MSPTAEEAKKKAEKDDGDVAVDPPPKNISPPAADNEGDGAALEAAKKTDQDEDVKKEDGGDAADAKDSAGEPAKGGAKADGDDEEDAEPAAPELTFPQQLMNVVDGESGKSAEEGAVMVKGERVIEWLPEGDAFIIRDKKALERDVLPKYFSSKCKFMSFVRKLYRQVPRLASRAGHMMWGHFA